ncbi:ATP-dependent RNA helicase SUPV3L1, mitochondrial isoform X2 [Lingula anatina]|nr:ATP-dependent RNA helicase SUPV3L1, mitochondrial isoform X2 [Lingula anatina]|eukprot:XP_013420566.1 ATP-dependent RNA helicase SUPV3L1, mitochondrial isoform X2 [Lingula anatina]
MQSFKSFKSSLLEAEELPTSLHVLLHDLSQKNGHVADLFPYFLDHAKDIFPHLECLHELMHISDLRKPTNWYPEARQKKRKIIFHAGPTNSGKTYQALTRFTTSQSGVYCGPLKLLANEVFNKTNSLGTYCDLVTGEERKYAQEDGIISDHVACTVEMVNTTVDYEIAVIDEIQMIRDYNRGWAWTRALLGVNADEIHLCGEKSAIPLIKDLLAELDEEVEVNEYERLTDLTIENSAMGSLENVQPGDCIVCFSKKAIYATTQHLEKLGHEVAVIYGNLPPGTKLAQAKRFNDPDDPCKILVATDAIGMGLNLSIRRIVFHSLTKMDIGEDGQKVFRMIAPSQALQIAGRAGRFGTDFENGFVTTLMERDLHKLRRLLNSDIPEIEKAGLHPTSDQIEMFSFYLPKLRLADLVDVFIHQCSLDGDRFFLSDMETFKELAELSAHIPLDLRVKYVFCVAPIKTEDKILLSFFLRYARQYSHAEPVTVKFIKKTLNWPLSPARTTAMINNLESVYQGLDLYRWFGTRFPDMFPDSEQIKEMQDEIDRLILAGVKNITVLQDASDTEETKVEKSPMYKKWKSALQVKEK